MKTKTILLTLGLILASFAANAQIITATNFDPRIAAPMDFREQLVDLTDTSTISFVYEGLMARVLNIDEIWMYDGTKWVKTNIVPFDESFRQGENVLYVSKETGENSSAIVGSTLYPFADPWAARDTAEARGLSDIVIIDGEFTYTGGSTGTYDFYANDDNLRLTFMRDGFQYYAYPGVSFSGDTNFDEALFGDTLGVTTTFLGFADFTDDNTVVHLSHDNSNLILQGNSLNHQGANTSMVTLYANVDEGFNSLSLDFREFNMPNGGTGKGIAFWGTSGTQVSNKTLNVNFDEVQLYDESFLFYNDPVDLDTSFINVNIKNLIATGETIGGRLWGSFGLGLRQSNVNISVDNLDVQSGPAFELFDSRTTRASNNSSVNFTVQNASGNWVFLSSGGANNGINSSTTDFDVKLDIANGVYSGDESPINILSEYSVAGTDFYIDGNISTDSTSVIDILGTDANVYYRGLLEVKDNSVASISGVAGSSIIVSGAFDVNDITYDPNVNITRLPEYGNESANAFTSASAYYVDPNGDNLTAAKGRIDLPFADPWTVAPLLDSSQTLIQINPGHYKLASPSADNSHIFLEDSTTILAYGAHVEILSTDDNTTTFMTDNSDGTNYEPVNLVLRGGIWELNEGSTSFANGFYLSHEESSQDVEIDKLIMSGGRVFGFYANVDTRARINEIITTGGVAFSVQQAADSSGAAADVITRAVDVEISRIKADGDTDTGGIVRYQSGNKDSLSSIKVVVSSVVDPPGSHAPLRFDNGFGVTKSSIDYQINGYYFQDNSSRTPVEGFTDGQANAGAMPIYTNTVIDSSYCRIGMEDYRAPVGPLFATYVTANTDTIRNSTVIFDFDQIQVDTGTTAMLDGYILRDNSKMIFRCGNCLNLSSPILSIWDMDIDETSEIIIEGNYRVTASKPVIETRSSITLKGNFTNDGTVPAIQSDQATTVYTEGAFSTNSIFEDDDVTIERKPEYGLDLTSGAATAFTDSTNYYIDLKGDDATALQGRDDFPYSSPWALKDSTGSFGNVIVNAGYYQYDGTFVEGTTNFLQGFDTLGFVANGYVTLDAGTVDDTYFPFFTDLLDNLTTSSPRVVNIDAPGLTLKATKGTSTLISPIAYYGIGTNVKADIGAAYFDGGRTFGVLAASEFADIHVKELYTSGGIPVAVGDARDESGTPDTTLSRKIRLKVDAVKINNNTDSNGNIRQQQAFTRDSASVIVMDVGNIHIDQPQTQASVTLQETRYMYGSSVEMNIGTLTVDTTGGPYNVRVLRGSNYGSSGEIRGSTVALRVDQAIGMSGQIITLDNTTMDSTNYLMEVGTASVLNGSIGAGDYFAEITGDINALNNSTITYSCRDCRTDQEGLPMINITSGVLTDATSWIEFTGTWRTSQAQPVLNIETTNANILLRDFNIANDGTVAAIQASSPVTVYVTGAFDFNAIIPDENVTFVRLDEYGLDLTSLGGATAFTSSNTLYVDPNGDDATAEKGRIDKPWKNPFVAALAAGDDDEIIVNTGNYPADSSRNILTNSIRKFSWSGILNYDREAGSATETFFIDDDSQDTLFVQGDEIIFHDRGDRLLTINDDSSYVNIHIDKITYADEAIAEANFGDIGRIRGSADIVVDRFYGMPEAGFFIGGSESPMNGSIDIGVVEQKAISPHLQKRFFMFQSAATVGDDVNFNARVGVWQRDKDANTEAESGFAMGLVFIQDGGGGSGVHSGVKNLEFGAVTIDTIQDAGSITGDLGSSSPTIAVSVDHLNHFVNLDIGTLDGDCVTTWDTTTDSDSSTFNWRYGNFTTKKRILDLYGGTMHNESYFTVDCKSCVVENDVVISNTGTDIDENSRLTLSGYFKTLEPGYPVIYSNEDIYLKDVVLENDGTVASIQAGVPITVYVAGAFDANSIISDPNVTIVRLSEYGLDLSSLGGATAFTDENVYYVDPNGDNDTGVKGRSDFPYEDLRAFIAVPSTGKNTYIVNPGIYQNSGPYNSALGDSVVYNFADTTHYEVLGQTEFRFDNTDDGLFYGFSDIDSVFGSSRAKKFSYHGPNSSLLIDRTGANSTSIAVPFSFYHIDTEVDVNIGTVSGENGRTWGGQSGAGKTRFRAEDIELSGGIAFSISTAYADTGQILTPVQRFADIEVDRVVAGDVVDGSGIFRVQTGTIDDGSVFRIKVGEITGDPFAKPWQIQYGDGSKNNFYSLDIGKYYRDLDRSQGVSGYVPGSANSGAAIFRDMSPDSSYMKVSIQDLKYTAGPLIGNYIDDGSHTNYYNTTLLFDIDQMEVDTGASFLLDRLGLYDNSKLIIRCSNCLNRESPIAYIWNSYVDETSQIIFDGNFETRGPGEAVIHTRTDRVFLRGQFTNDGTVAAIQGDSSATVYTYGAFNANSIIEDDNITFVRLNEYGTTYAPDFAYVSTNGNDATAQVGSPLNPFATISAALVAQGSNKRVYLMPGKHYLRDTAHYNMPLDTIQIFGPEATIVADDDTEGIYFMEMNDASLVPSYIEFDVDRIIDNTINNRFDFFNTNYSGEVEGHIRLGSYVGDHGSANVGFNGLFYLATGSVNMDVRSIHNPPSIWVRDDSEGSENESSVIKIGDVTMDWLPTDSVRLDGIIVSRYNNQTNSTGFYEIENINFNHGSAVDSLYQFIGAANTAYTGSYHYKITNLRDSSIQNHIDLDDIDAFASTTVGWQTRTVTYEGTYHGSKVHIEHPNVDARSFTVGGTSGFDLDSTYYLIDLGNVESDKRVIEFYSMDVRNNSTLHIHCDNCVTTNDKAIHLRDGTVDNTSKVIFSGRWATTRDSFPTAYIGVDNVHFIDAVLDNDGQLEQVYAPSAKTIYYNNLTSPDSLWTQANVTWVPYDDFENDTSTATADGDGILDATNDGGTVPTEMDINITDNLRFAGGSTYFNGTLRQGDLYTNSERFYINDMTNADTTMFGRFYFSPGQMGMNLGDDGEESNDWDRNIFVMERWINDSTKVWPADNGIYDDNRMELGALSFRTRLSGSSDILSNIGAVTKPGSTSSSPASIITFYNSQYATAAGSLFEFDMEDGNAQFTGYGDGTFTGTAASYPAFDADGNLIESLTPYGSGSSDGNGILDATNDGGTVPTSMTINITDSITYSGGVKQLNGTQLLVNDDGSQSSQTSLFSFQAQAENGTYSQLWGVRPFGEYSVMSTDINEGVRRFGFVQGGTDFDNGTDLTGKDILMEDRIYGKIEDGSGDYLTDISIAGSRQFRFEGYGSSGLPATRYEISVRDTSETGSFPYQSPDLVLSHDGKFRLPAYGDGSVTGTAASYPAFDADGNLIESLTPYSSGGSSDGDGILDATNDGDTIRATTINLPNESFRIQNQSNPDVRFEMFTSGAVGAYGQFGDDILNAFFFGRDNTQMFMWSDDASAYPTYTFYREGSDGAGGRDDTPDNVTLGGIHFGDRESDALDTDKIRINANSGVNTNNEHYLDFTVEGSSLLQIGNWDDQISEGGAPLEIDADALYLGVDTIKINSTEELVFWNETDDRFSKLQGSGVWRIEGQQTTTDYRWTNIGNDFQMLMATDNTLAETAIEFFREGSDGTTRGRDDTEDLSEMGAIRWTTKESLTLERGVIELGANLISNTDNTYQLFFEMDGSNLMDFNNLGTNGLMNLGVDSLNFTQNAANMTFASQLEILGSDGGSAQSRILMNSTTAAGGTTIEDRDPATPANTARLKLDWDAVSTLETPNQEFSISTGTAQQEFTGLSFDFNPDDDANMVTIQGQDKTDWLRFKYDFGAGGGYQLMYEDGVTSNRTVFDATANQLRLGENFSTLYLEMDFEHTAGEGVEKILVLDTLEQVVRAMPNPVLSIATEVSGATTAVVGTELPVNCSGGAVTITPPASPSANDRFAVFDSRASSSSNNITIDFTGSSQSWNGQSADYTISTDAEYVEFRYVNSTIGWRVQK